MATSSRRFPLFVAAAFAMTVAGGCYSDDAPTAADRGQYLVHVVSSCIDCHTPRRPDGSPDFDRLLSGARCFIDAEPEQAGVGCLHSRNLTNHPTGLANRSDAEIKRMFQQGIRPNGDALFPVMPYWVYHNMTDEDADAVIAYLRTVPGIDHLVPPNEAPFDVPPPGPAIPIPGPAIPFPDTNHPDYGSAMRGRYLAGMAGLCIDCHTPEAAPPFAVDLERLFAGGRSYPGLPVPPFNVPVSVAPNITPHATGIASYTASELDAVLRLGVEKTGDGICPPMPAGLAGYAFLSERDRRDIVTYIQSLPAIDNEIVRDTCTPPSIPPEAP